MTLPFALTEVWFLLSGTQCDLSCAHCFLSAGPGDERHGPLPRRIVRRYRDEAADFGVSRFGVTGGEPTLHAQVIEILGDLLETAPTTLLTNGLGLGSDFCAELADMAARRENPLTVRASIERADEKENDRIRGRGAHRLALAGARRARAAGLDVVIAATVPPETEPAKIEAGLADLFGGSVETLPLLPLGRAVGHSPPPAAFSHRLPCSYSRTVADDGVYPCPLLLDSPSERMGNDLASSMGPFERSAPTCGICRHLTGG